jgi:drug/metabolite transporter superfamily protein YnfA
MMDDAQTRPSGWSPARGIWLSLVAAIVGAICLALHFPGYFDPFAVYHTDHFAYVGLHHEGAGAVLRYLRDYPRPFGYMLLHQSGRLGIDGVLAPVFAAGVLNVALAALYVERITRRRVALPCFVFFAALVFANPEFYWGYKNDPLAFFSLTLLLAAFHVWHSYVESGNRLLLAAAAVLFALSSLTKESYFFVLILFQLIQLVLCREHRRGAAFLLLMSGGVIAFALIRAARWAVATSVSDVYHRSLDPISLMQGFLTIGRSMVVPAAAISLLALLIAAWRRDRRTFLVMSAALSFAALSILPNATLPNHLFPHYAALGLAFVFAPVLLIDRSVPSRTSWQVAVSVVCLVVYAGVLAGYRSSIRGAAGWVRSQEVLTRQLIETFDSMTSQMSPGETALVTGMTMPFNPFLVPYFVYGEMCGHCFWTVTVGREIKESRERNVRLIHADNQALLEHYDRLFAVASDGTLAGSFTPPETTERSRKLYLAARPAEVAGNLDAALPGPASWRVTFHAEPNPAPADTNGLAKVNLHWSMPSASLVEVRVGAPSGTIFAVGPPSGSGITGSWVADGTRFFLQDASRGDPTSPENTVAVLEVSVTRGSIKPQSPQP